MVNLATGRLSVIWKTFFRSLIFPPKNTQRDKVVEESLHFDKMRDNEKRKTNI